MIIQSKTYKKLVRLLKVLSKKSRKSLFSLLPIAFLAGLADIAVIGLISRLFTLVSGQANRPSFPFSKFLTQDTPTKILLLVILYCLMNWVSSSLKLILKAKQYNIKSKIQFELSELAHRNILYKPYEFFLRRKNSDISATILLVIDRVSNLIIQPILESISAIIIIIFIAITILSLEKIIALFLIVSMLVVYALVSVILTPFMRFASKKRISFEEETNAILNEGLKTMIELQLTSSENYFDNKYKHVGKKTLPYIWKSELFPEIPRILLEPFGITIIFASGIIPSLYQGQAINLIEIIPFLATISVSCLKLVPPLQDLFRGFTNLRAGIPDLNSTLDLVEVKDRRLTILSKEVPSSKGIEPREFIKLNNISYKYPMNEKYILNRINMTITVGSRIAFIGKTGSGKTTTANQLLCLLRPTLGSIELDGIEITDNEVPAWQACCSYVPQRINLLNSSICENIAYGIEKPQIDEGKVWEALESARLIELVSDLQFGIHTLIGENGVRLSGGQRQRLALARAFYKSSKFLVLDEATSALDNQTESEVMNAIEVIGRRSTIIVIAHRLSTLRNADYIYEFDKGQIKTSGTFEQLLNTSESFQKMIKYSSNAKEF